jgi:hypothetical protein
MSSIVGVIQNRTIVKMMVPKNKACVIWLHGMIHMVRYRLMYISYGMRRGGVLNG